MNFDTLLPPEIMTSLFGPDFRSKTLFKNLRQALAKVAAGSLEDKLEHLAHALYWPDYAEYVENTTFTPMSKTNHAYLNKTTLSTDSVEREIENVLIQRRRAGTIRLPN